MIGLVVDSGCDLPGKYAEKEFVEVVPLKIILDGKEYKDNEGLSTEALLSYMENALPKTSLPSFDDVNSCFESLYERGYKEIIVVNISSGLSGTHNFFRVVADEFMKKHDDAKVELIDTKNISIGAGFIAIKGINMIEKGAKFDDIVKALKASVKKSKVFFCVPTLKYLKAGGRIGKVSATIGDILNLKPVITVNEDGIYHSIAKARGMQRAIKELYKKLKEFVNASEVELAAIYTSDSSEETKKHVAFLNKSFSADGIKDIIYGSVTQSLVCHTGVGLVGIGALLKG